MELQVGDFLTIKRGGYPVGIVKIEHVTAKRAYADKNKNTGNWSYEWRREQSSPDFLSMIGLGEWSHISSSITVDSDKEYLLKQKTLRLARDYFDKILKDSNKTIEAYEKLISG